MPPLRGPFPTTWEKNTFYDTEIEQISAGGPPAYLKAVDEWVGFLAIRISNRQRGADEPSALRHPPLLAGIPAHLPSHTLGD